MKKFWIQIIILIAAGLGAIYIGFNSGLIEKYFPITGNLTQTEIRIGNSTIKIEVADTSAKRSQGLSGRDKLDNGSGMLFVFPEEKKYQFWMKGMKFPLDMIFVKKGVVVDLLSNVPAPKEGQSDQNLPIYSPVAPIDMMLEVNSGFVVQNNIRVGDTVYLLK